MLASRFGAGVGFRSVASGCGRFAARAYLAGDAAFEGDVSGSSVRAGRWTRWNPGYAPTSPSRSPFSFRGSGGRPVRAPAAYRGPVRLPRDFVVHVRRSELLRRGDRVLVACSGGSDSIALLRLLVATRAATDVARIAVAHLDHGLRDGSEEDAAFVADLARELGLPSCVERRRVVRRKRESPEEAARRVRYAFLASAARKLGCDVVATAHQLDDQAETVLYRVLRGTGLGGLRGVAPATRLGSAGPRLVRPLLPFRRAALRRWLVAEGAAWREDPTNAEGNDRAKIRNRLLPLVRTLLGRDPSAPLARLAQLAQDEFRRTGSSARPEPSAPRPRVGPSAPRTVLTWEERPLRTGVFLERLRSKPGTLELVDAAAVRGELVSRLPRRGDRFEPLGLATPQRLGHYLQRKGVPAAARKRIQLLCDDEGILCVAGFGIARRAAVTEATKRVVIVRASRSEP